MEISLDIGKQNSSVDPLPLCVDLDGTVLRTDLVFESLAAAARQKPLSFLLTPWRLLKGRPHLKRLLAEEIEIDPRELPLHTPVIDYLRTQRALGRKIILVTASDQGLAEKIVQHLEVFDEVVGTAGARNLKGREKAQYLVGRFGARGFEYLGDSKADLHVWRSAGGGGVVTSSARFAGAARRESHSLQHFEIASLKMQSVLKALRVHQWVKNILLFVPLFLAHKIMLPELFGRALLGFFVFSFCASAVYVLNDVLDLSADRQHPSKRNRPFASGTVPIQWAFFLVPIFLALAAALCVFLPMQFVEFLIAYFVLTVAYSLYLKQIALIDILLLAALYSIRLLAGGAVTGVVVSQWLVAFAMFFFFSLACVKRYSELLALRNAKKQQVLGRGYRASDLEQIGAFGAASGYLAILVLALYVNSGEVAVLYRHPSVLWLLCPAMLYWVSRVWLLAHRDEMHDDPIVFALSDAVSYVVGIVAVAVVWLAV